MTEHSLRGLLRMDMTRAFCSKRYWGSIVGITLLCILNTTKQPYIPDVLYTFLYIRRSILHLLTFILCTLPYATGICEDMDTFVIKSIIVRSDYFKYAISKVFVCNLSAVSAF